MALLSAVLELLTTRRICARDLKPRDIVVFDDGERRAVLNSRFGEDFATYKGRLAMVLIIDFDDGLVVKTHPGAPVIVAKSS